MARPLLWSILGTHMLRLSRLDCSVWPTSILRDGNRLVSSLRSRLTYNSASLTVAHFCDSWCTNSKFWTSSKNWPGSESFSHIGFLHDHVDLLFFDHRCLVTNTLGSSLLGPHTTSWIWPKVFYLPNVTSLFHVSQNNSSFSYLFSVQTAFSDTRFDKLVLWHKEACARLLRDSLAQLRVTPLLRHLVFYPSTATSFSPYELSLSIFIVFLSTKSDLVDFINGIRNARSRRLGSLRRGFLESACVLNCALSGKNASWWIRLCSGLSPRLLGLITGPHYWCLSFRFCQNFINSLLLMDLELCKIIARYSRRSIDQIVHKIMIYVFQTQLSFRYSKPLT